MIASAAQSLKSDSLVLDGELVAVDAQGRPSFQALQHRGAYPQYRIVYYVFDIQRADCGCSARRPLGPVRVCRLGITWKAANVARCGLRLHPSFPIDHAGIQYGRF
jgi:hypothetical protein